MEGDSLSNNKYCNRDEEAIYETILHGIEARMNTWILIGNFGAMRTDDEATQGYYLVKWITKPYTVQEDTIMKGIEPQQTTFAGEIICDALFWNPVPGEVDWYTQMIHTDEKTGGTGYDKNKAGADDSCDDYENNRGQYAT